MNNEEIKSLIDNKINHKETALYSIFDNNFLEYSHKEYEKPWSNVMDKDYGDYHIFQKWQDTFEKLNLSDDDKNFFYDIDIPERISYDNIDKIISKLDYFKKLYQNISTIKPVTKNQFLGIAIAFDLFEINSSKSQNETIETITKFITNNRKFDNFGYITTKHSPQMLNSMIDNYDNKENYDYIYWETEKDNI